MASRRTQGEETSHIRNSDIKHTDWTAVGKDIGNPAPRGPNERWLALRKRVTLLDGISIRSKPGKRNQVKKGGEKKPKAKTDFDAQMGVGESDDSGKLDIENSGLKEDLAEENGAETIKTDQDDDWSDA